MTLDQIFMRLAELKTLRKGGERVVKMSSNEVSAGGAANMRRSDGSTIKAISKGRSLARRLMDEEKAKQAEAAQNKPKQSAARKRRAAGRQERRERRRVERGG